jgi:glycosyltransferase involved in cell wall biosynthesis
MFTPLPPRPTGIADYSYELLTGLSRDFNCTVVIDDGHGEATAPPGVTVISAIDYSLSAHRYCSMLHIYQVGNNPDHVYMLPLISEQPGLVVLHDPSLHHLMDNVTILAGDFRGLVDAFAAEHGVAGRLLGEQLRDFGLRETRMYFDMPMIRGITGPSRGVIVHSRYAAVKVLARSPRTCVTLVPHPYCPPAARELEDPYALRRQLGVEDGDLLFMSLGFITRSKQIDMALRALASIRDQLPAFKYLIIGELQDKEINFEALAKELGLQNEVILIGYVAEHRFFALIRAADVVINLRYPIAGETSGTMIRALGAGACIVVVDRGAFAEIPDGAAIRIPWGPEFELLLARELLRLALNPDLRRSIGENARSFIAANNNLDATVAGYKAAIGQAQGTDAPRWSTMATWKFLSPHELVKFVRMAKAEYGSTNLPLWYCAGVMPLCSDSKVKLHVIGGDDSLDNRLLAFLGYDIDSQNSRVSSARFAKDGALAGPERACDLILVLPNAALIADEPSVVLVELNRRLAFGGVLVWHIVRNSGRAVAHPLETRLSGARLMEANGFCVDASVTGMPPLIDGVNEGSRDLERCWRVVKISETFAKPDFMQATSEKTVASLGSAVIPGAA